MNNKQLQFRPFTCYFCNKTISNDTESVGNLKGHNSTCGAVLEPCPNRCGLYVPRNMRLKHMSECKNTLRRSKSSSKLNQAGVICRNSADLGERQIIYNGGGSLDRVKMKPPPVSNTYTNSSDLKTILNKQKNLDQICMQLSQNVVVLRSQHQEALQSQKTSHMQTKMHLDKLVYQYQILTEWRKAIEIQMENFKIEMLALQKCTSDIGKRFETSETSRISTIASLTEQLNRHKLETGDVMSNLYSTISELKDNFTQENATVAALWNDQKFSVDQLKVQIENLTTVQNEQKVKNGTLVFDLKSVSEISRETSEKLELHERKVDELKRQLAQLRLDLENRLDEERVFSDRDMFRVDVPGRLLWRIDKFEAKMDSSKKHDTVLKSPVFYTHQFGYKARLHIYLNGIKKWKGRHTIMCLHILKGDYDFLLKWPCYIEGTVSIRDLYNTQPNVTDFSKYISSKRQTGGSNDEEPHESSSQFIFIPHTTLLKQNFIREDIVFIDVKINHVNRGQDETDL